MDLSKMYSCMHHKALDCILHDLLIAKIVAYGFEGKTLPYIYMNLENRKQCLNIST